MAMTEDPVCHTDSNTYSLHSQDGVDTWAVHHYARATPNDNSFNEYHHFGVTDDWQARALQKSHAPNFKGRRRNETILAVMSQWIVEHQIGML